MQVDRPARIPVKRGAYQQNMSLCRKKTKENTGRGLLIITALLLFTFIQSGFPANVYPGVTKPDAGPNKTDAPNKINVIAELDGIPITTQDLLKRYNLFLVMSGSSSTYRERVSVNSYLDSYIKELLLLKEANRMKINAGRDEIEKEKKEFLEKNNISEDELLKNLADFKLTMDDVNRYFKNNIIIIKFGREKFGDIDVSDEDARKYYDRNIDSFVAPEKIAARHILICHKDSKGCRSDLGKEQAKKIAESIRKLATPGNFAELAQQFSTDRTGADGGDLGYITRGEAVPAFEKAAFALNKGEISDVVETEFGYHIIFVTEKRKARSVTFEEARESIKNDLKKEYIASALFSYSPQLLKEAHIKRFVPGQSLSIETGLNTDEEKAADKKSKSPLKNFKTFKSTGLATNVNSNGKPVILLFSSMGCSHCQWISETFDEVVKEYVQKGLIEAHHYDVDTKDDLLTRVHEAEIPEPYLKLKEERDKDYVPYFNFGGLYERNGNGYEEQDDFFAEEMEMRQVIDALLKLKK